MQRRIFFKTIVHHYDQRYGKAFCLEALPNAHFSRFLNILGGLPYAMLTFCEGIQQQLTDGFDFEPGIIADKLTTHQPSTVSTIQLPLHIH